MSYLGIIEHRTNQLLQRYQVALHHTPLLQTSASTRAESRRGPCAHGSGGIARAAAMEEEEKEEGGEEGEEAA